MHRDITQAPKGTQVDHENGDGLDNQRHNLRLASQSGQSKNSKSQRGSTSKYKGVSWHTKRHRWRAVIKVAKKQIHLLYTTSEERAAHAYDEAAIRHFGDFACLNFPYDGERSAANA